MNSINKVLLLSHIITLITRVPTETFFYIINILSNNNYPLDIIFSSIKKRLSIKFQQINNHRTPRSQDKIKENYFVVPYINNITDKFNKTF